ncbi:MAG: chromosome partitioning protein [Acidobacteria bacterium RIFCSPLOWO2_12_FULL_54_10]|nr:MAG: chromosome partitioning protein [Acidobacteria bacterium RIFCSPLOWO2_12_FULL_54_10]
MPTQEQVLTALRKVMDPDLHRDIVTLGFVRDLKIDQGKVSFSVVLTTPACPVKDRLKEESEQAVRAIPGVDQVTVDMRSDVRPAPPPPGLNLVPGVRNIVPVGSGKGGVGKSTVSANLAVALAKSGARVGLMDADVYGPSIPTILGITELPTPGTKGIRPVVAHGVKVISSGFFMKPGQAVIWRGPMLGKLIDQFLSDVEWGELDYLVIDLPPGTGDVQLTLCQRVPLTGAVIVSTPQDVALTVAQKALDMFRQLRCPILGIIENMSYFICPHCGERENIFDTGGAERAAAEWGVPLLGRIPLATGIRIASDSGRPIILDEPDSSSARAFLEISQNLAAQISIQNMKETAEPALKISF